MGSPRGTQPLFSESYGAGNSKDVHKILRYGILTCLIVEALVVICAWSMTDSLIAIFNSEQNLQLITYAQSGMRLYFLRFLLAGINILLVSYFSAVDDEPAGNRRICYARSRCDHHLCNPSFQVVRHRRRVDIFSCI